MQAKPRNPTIYRRQGMPIWWAYLDGPRKTRPGDAGDVADLTRRSPAATRSASVTWADGPYGRSLSISGSTTGVSLPTLAAMPGGITFLCRCTPTSVTGWHALLAFNNGTSNWELYNGRQIIGYPEASTTAIAANETHELAVTVAPNYASKFYLDGRADGSGSSSVAGWPLAHPPLYLGSDGAVSDSWTGKIHWVAIWPRVLTATEIAREYADPWWRLRPEYVSVGWHYVPLIASPPVLALTATVAPTYAATAVTAPTLPLTARTAPTLALPARIEQ